MDFPPSSEARFGSGTLDEFENLALIIMDGDDTGSTREDMAMLPLQQAPTTRRDDEVRLGGLILIMFAYYFFV